MSKNWKISNKYQLRYYAKSINTFMKFFRFIFELQKKIDVEMLKTYQNFYDDRQ